MAYSRISRREEKRTKKILVLTFIGITILLALTVTLGVPLIIGVSVFISNLANRASVVENSDKTAPFPPVLSSLPSATNSATLKLSGYGEPGANVYIYLNGTQVKKILLASDGTFSYNEKILKDGINTLYAKAQDAVGNISEPSEKQVILFTNKPPKLEISNPQENQNFTKSQQETTIKGITDPGVDLRINDRFVSVNDDGTFAFTLRLHDGENTLSLVARDQASNETKLERKVTYSP